MYGYEGDGIVSLRKKIQLNKSHGNFLFCMFLLLLFTVSSSSAFQETRDNIEAQTTLTSSPSVSSGAIIFQQDNNDNFSWRNDTARVENVVFDVVGEFDAQVTRVLDGQIDATSTFPLSAWLNTDLAKNAMQTPGVNVSVTTSRDLIQLAYNNARWPTDNVHLRRALAFALDKWAIIRDIFKGSARPVDGLITPGFGIWSLEHPSHRVQFSHDYYESRLLNANHSLLRGGFYDVDGDGWREWFNATRAGKEWEQVVNVTMFTPDAEHPNATIANSRGLDPPFVIDAQAFGNLSNWDDHITLEVIGSCCITTIEAVLNRTVEAWKRVGLNATVILLAGALFKFVEQGKFHVAYFGLGASEDNPVSMLKWFKSDNAINKKTWRWYNASYDQLMHELKTALTHEEALQVVLDAQRVLWYSQPFVAVASYLKPSVYRNDRFEGWMQPPGLPVVNKLTLLRLHPSSVNGERNASLTTSVNIGITTNLLTLNPLITTDEEVQDLVLGLIYDSLWIEDPFTLQMKPWLADKWSVTLVENTSLQPLDDLVLNNDSMTPTLKVTFYLNPNFKWHDGKPVTPEDVKFSYQLYAKQLPSGLYSQFHAMTTAGGGTVNADRIEIDEKSWSVTFILENMTSYFSLRDTGAFILPRHIWQPLLEQHGFEWLLAYKNSNPIGSGPYQWAGRVEETRIFLTRNPHWPFLPRIMAPPTTSPPKEGSGVLITFGSFGGVSAMLLGIIAIVVFRRMKNRSQKEKY